MILKWIRGLLGRAAANPKKPGPIPIEEMHSLVVQAFQQVVADGKYANEIYDQWSVIDCHCDIMAEFMRICDYHLTTKEIVKAKKLCEKYVNLVFSTAKSS